MSSLAFYNDKYKLDDFFEQKPDIKKFGESKMSHKSKVSRKKKESEN
jgi:hypothetical protein